MNRRGFLQAGCAALTAQALRAQSDSVAIVLVASKRWVTIAGQPAELLTYNGQVPGPQLDLRPGQDVTIRLVNDLSEPTNLHFHGLHLPPSPGVDDVFLQIPPGEQHEYRFTLPADHPAGTFWYHPHIHGSTARQVGGGLAGAIIVRDELEADLGLSRVPERVLILQDFDLRLDGALATPTQIERMNGHEGALIALSGEVTPDISVPSSGVARLRFINACSARFFDLAAGKQPLVVIGVDGGLMGAPLELPSVLLAPGERVDTIISGPARTAGPDLLSNLPYQRGITMMMGGPRSGGTNNVLAQFVPSSADGAQWTVPGKLADFSPLPPPSRLRTFVLGQGAGMGMGMGARFGMGFTINGRTFDMQRVDTTVRLGDVEEWEFVNNTMMDHPMHVHTNAFQVIGGGGSVRPAWKDTVLVKAGERVRVRTRFDDFTGLAVYHCHILDHEDMGMMGTLRISDR